MKLIFATNNTNKLKEIKNILNTDFDILSLKDIDCYNEIPEDHDTLEENASQKAWYIYNKYKINCFADDTGLEVDALNGEPGVYSARYAGKNRSFDDNNNKLLKKLEGAKNRKARFRTIISLIIDGKETKFEGIVNGEILAEKQGEKGFGYDPIFKPENYNVSFAEMKMDIKNKISHRGRAIKKLVNYLQKM
ncbi:MAG: non-canonical purine NTP diphosphatase [Bacteroidota bacterium]|nr:non-canonical purine NTP diphosphatase [Bacteroidota bacterium]